MPPVFIHPMPAVNPTGAGGSGAAQGQRTTFRPPWVKEGPTPLPMPAAPWTARSRESLGSEQTAPVKEKPQLRKQSKITIIPSQPGTRENGQGEGTARTVESIQAATEKALPVSTANSASIPVSKEKVIPIVSEISPPKTVNKEKVIPIATENSPLKPVSKEKAVPIVTENSPQKPVSKEKLIPIANERSTPKPDSKEKAVNVKTDSRTATKPPPQPQAKEKSISLKSDPNIKNEPSMKSEERQTPPLPPKAPPAPVPPPPPPMQGMGLPTGPKKPVSAERVAKLESLRSRPRRRPDWSDMMKEVEEGRKLKHIECNDRSAPVLPKAKAKGQFIYESEKDNTHNQLLKQIQGGVMLKRAKCNDRSKPLLDGLRKFRRQMTIEEQIQKSASVADVVAVAAEPDELDDIDKVRDDLQSTKQMLALELRNKEALERDNRRLAARLLNLEAELREERAARPVAVDGATRPVRTDDDEKLMAKLKEESALADTVAKEMEDKYHKSAEELDATRAKLESAWLRNQQLELQLKAAESHAVMPIMKQPSSKKLVHMPSVANGKDPEVHSEEESEYEEETETETEEEGDDEDAEAAQERRTARELKLLVTKVRSYREKHAASLKERRTLREQLNKQQKALRDEKKKYRVLQKEVDKMAKLMKDVDDEDEEEEEKPEEEEEESETESESEESEEEEEEDDEKELSRDANTEDKKRHLSDRSKHLENRLTTLKKGNYLLKANIDRMQDDLNRQREMSLTLQEDLNSVLAELG